MIKSSKPVRVFMIGFSDHKGGVESYISNLCAAMDQTEFEIVYQLPEMQIDGKKWVCPQNRHNYIKYWLFWREFFQENHFDVLYLNTCDVVSIDSLRFAKRAGIPIRILHSHSSGIQQQITKKASLLHRISEKRNRRTLEKYATHLFACSQIAGAWMFDGRPFRIIKNGITLSKYQENPTARRKLRMEYGLGEQLVVGMIGRIAPTKNPLFAVKILEELIKRTKTAKAVFIGNGDLITLTKQAVKDAGIEDSVIFTGEVSNVNEWMSAIDCVLMPSLFEGLPFVLVEAQAAGLPCVASSTVSREADLTGLVEFVDLEQPPEVWAEKILSVCGKPRPDTRQQLIDAGYSIEDTAKTVSEIITKALEEHNAEKSH